jgi:threonine/homoserine/homoserine lactone efflux protein
MGPAIGEILAYALGIAISPIPIIAVILLLMSPKARGTSVGFLLGWLVGIIAATAVFTALSSIIPQQDGDGSNPIGGVIKLVLGALLLVLAIGQWRKRPQDGVEPHLPKWMAAIDTLTAVKGFGLGFLLSAVNPKNLIMGAAAGQAIGAAGLPLGQIILIIAIFTLIAGSTVLIPVVAFLIAGDRAREPLARMRVWLVDNNATIMAVLLLVIGVALIGKGIGSF